LLHQLHAAGVFGGRLDVGRRPVTVVVARAHDVDLDAAELILGLLGRWAWCGGGRPDVAQSGGLNADPDEVAEFARRLVGHPLK
jgi:hypothetical protein